jgi:glycosyltransferase involved in cell wall biosynthesis
MISVLVPTRNRPHSVKRLLDSAYATADTDVEFIFYVDQDDPSYLETLQLTGVDNTITGPRVVLSEMWNACAKVARHDIMMHCGDDIVFRSDDWDTKVLEEFDHWPDKIVFVHGRDGYQDARLGTHGFLHRRWVDAVGYLVPPYFSSDYNDLWLTEVADALDRRRYLPDIYTEHMHPAAGKGEWDQTHQERLVRHKRDKVDRIYRSKIAEREADIKKLRAIIDEEMQRVGSK